MITTIPALKESVLAMVFATLEWRTRTVNSAPRRLNTAESSTAWVAFSARVETEVAMALAVSWNPLVKSNATAAAIVPTSRTSSILDRDRLQDVGGGLAAVHGCLEEVVDVFPLDQFGRRAVVGEEGGERLPGDQVGLVLQAVDLDPAGLELFEALQVLERARHHVARPGQVLAHPAGVVADLADVVEVDLVRYLFGQVDDVVERGDEGEDVLALDRRHEGAVDQAVDLVRHVVRLVLEVAQPRMPGAAFEQAFGELDQGLLNKLTLLREEVVEAALL